MIADLKRAATVPAWNALLILVVVAAATRAVTFFNPIVGFDEQFYLVVGDRLLHGQWPYVAVFDRKPVGLFLIYAVAAAFGGGAFLAYKLLALAAAVATALRIRRIARPFAGAGGAIAAAIFYLLWLILMEGEGGQTPVFYNLPMAIAGGLVAGAIARPERVARLGFGAMAAVGIALQIKYSAVFEGVYFGLALAWVAWRAGRPPLRWAILLAGWVLVAMLPTLAVAGGYMLAGHGREFFFCNFVSFLGQKREPWVIMLGGVAMIFLILAIPLVLIAVDRPWRHVAAARRAGYRFMLGWFLVATVGLLTYRRFGAPHYGLPLLVPLMIVLAPALGRGPRRLVVPVAAIALAAGQLVLHLSTAVRGGPGAARAVAAAAQPRRGCIFVYDGYPALYLLTGSCLPSRWIFPGHLNAADEASTAALGADPVREISRIMAARPDAVIDTYPSFVRGNRVDHAIVQRALARDYRLAACVPTGRARIRLVYRRRDDPTIVPAGDCGAYERLRAFSSQADPPGGSQGAENRAKPN